MISDAIAKTTKKVKVGEEALEVIGLIGSFPISSLSAEFVVSLKPVFRGGSPL